LTQSYRIRLRCFQRDCDFGQWVVKENEPLSLAEVYDKEWDFFCPSHGPQRRKPFWAQVKRVFVAPKRDARGSQRETTRHDVEPLTR
jgi:hypothetical protein